MERNYELCRVVEVTPQRPDYTDDTFAEGLELNPDAEPCNIAKFAKALAKAGVVSASITPEAPTTQHLQLVATSNLYFMEDYRGNTPTAA